MWTSIKTFWSIRANNRKLFKQECIPVGSIPPLQWPSAWERGLSAWGGGMSARGCARFPEILQNFSERQILWNLCSVGFHAFTMRFPIQTLLSMAPKFPVFACSGEKWKKISKTSTPHGEGRGLYLPRVSAKRGIHPRGWCLLMGGVFPVGCTPPPCGKNSRHTLSATSFLRTVTSVLS